MPFADTLIQIPLTAIPFSHLLLALAQLTLLGGVLMFFRPLLVGIVRALVLVVRPRRVRHIRAGIAGAEPADAIGAAS